MFDISIYTSILTWLPGFLDKIGNLILSLLCVSILDAKETPPAIEVCWKSVGAMYGSLSQIASQPRLGMSALENAHSIQNVKGVWSNSMEHD